MYRRLCGLAWLPLGLVCIAGVASAQPGLSISQIDASGNVTKSNFDPSVFGPEARAPRAGKYWDGLASTDFYNSTTQVTNPPNPQIGTGPDDIVTIVNRTIARYPNPNAIGNSLVTTPYNNPPTSKAFLDVWMGISNLAAACPTVPRSNSTCVIDNASVRYDQMQGRFVVLFTVTDVPSHISNFILVISRFGTFNCPSAVVAAGNCPNTSDMFTPPIVPVVGGPNTGGTNQYWVMYTIPINVVLPAPATDTFGVPFCMAPFVGGNPLSPPAPIGLVQVMNGFSSGPITSGCTDYFPTGARFGLDNDNIILTAPVLDVSQETNPTALRPGCLSTATVGCGPILPGGPYAGTRVVTVPKVVVYNGVPLGGDPRNISGTGTGLVNLSDDTLTGTFTALTKGPVVTPTPACCVSVSPPIFPAIFWEPDNLRGRALASFNAQVGPFSSTVGGVVTPIDYLVGRQITDNFGIGEQAEVTNILYLQPIVFTCPTAALFAGPAGVPYCGSASTPTNPGGGQVAETSSLAIVEVNPALGAYIQFPRLVSPIALTEDPAPVGQGKNDLAVNLAQDGTPLPRLFVGDQRPQQVMFREGLVYVASTLQVYDSTGAASFGTATVMYNILKPGAATCALPALPGPGAGPNPPNAAGTSLQGDFCTAAVGGPGAPSNPFTANGSRIGLGLANFPLNGAAEVLETFWFNGTNVPNPSGNITGYGFYAPAFDSPANVINGSSLPNSSGISPINLFPWLEKLFVGNTVGGPATINNTFATHFPSMWDIRPGDDGYDTNLPYLDPVRGNIVVSDRRLCQPAFQALATTTAGNIVLSNLAPPVSSLPLANNQAIFGTGIAPGAMVASFSASANTITMTLAATATLNRTAVTVIAPPPGGAPGGGCSMIPFGFRAGASTDPNDGSLWIYGPFAKFRLSSIIGPGQWGTTVANYQLDFPTTDPYGNDNSFFGDVPTTYPFFTWIQIAKNAGIWTNGFASSSCTPNQPNPPVIPPPSGTGSGGTAPGAGLACTNFQPTDTVTRAEMAMWVVRSQMDDNQVITFLNATGGLPLISGLGATSFADNPNIPNVAGCPVPANPPQGQGTQFCSQQTIANYIETMYRRGYTKGCGATSDARRMYCPADIVTRGQMAVFLVRAKMSNVFPTSLSGIPLSLAAGNSSGFASPYGDAFGFFTPALAYFTDCTPSSCGASVTPAGAAYIYVQKMRELRITNGKNSTTTYVPDDPLTRQEIATFVVRAFLL